MNNKVITGYWDNPIWREKTPQEKAIDKASTEKDKEDMKKATDLLEPFIK